MIPASSITQKKKKLMVASVNVGIFWLVLLPSTGGAWEATSPKVNEPRGTERRFVDRLERFLKSGQWDEAFEIHQRILDSQSDSVVSVGKGKFVSLQEHCHRLISQLQPEPLARYRDLVDATAEVWYRRGIKNRDARILRRIVDQAFCSRWGDDALWALGELALEQGDYTGARTYWQSLHPELAGGDCLAFPDTDFPLADLRARLVLVSIREGDRERAERELAELRALYGGASGRLGGRRGVYADFLGKLVDQIRAREPLSQGTDWTTFRGSPQRAGSAAEIGLDYAEHFSIPLVNGLQTFPVIVEGRLIVQDASGVREFDLESGKETFLVNHEVFAATTHKGIGRVLHTLTAAGQLVVGERQVALGKSSSIHSQFPESVVWGIDRERDGALSFQIRRQDTASSFAGAPLIGEDKLWVPIRSNDRNARAGIACYHIGSGDMLWQNWFCQANTPATSWNQDVLTLLPAMEGNRIYMSTNLGVVGTVRADDGRILWLSTYNRLAVPLNSKKQSTYYRGPSAAVLLRAALFVLPTDSKELLALDTVSGELLWSHPLESDDAMLVGASGDRLVVSDRGLKVFNVSTGKPFMERQDLVLQGRAICCKNTVLWPDGEKVRLLDLKSGNLVDYALPLPHVGSANLVLADDYVVIVQAGGLTVFQANATPTSSRGESPLP